MMLAQREDDTLEKTKSLYQEYVNGLEPYFRNIDQGNPCGSGCKSIDFMKSTRI
jgi:hypothetical protein